MNDHPDFVSADADSPALFSHHIVDTLIASMASCLQCISAKSARGRHSVAGSNVDRVRRMSHMEGASKLSCLWSLWIGTRWNRQTEPRRR